MSDPTGQVLIVDDESAILQTLTITLRAFGFRTEAAPTGEEALRRVQREKYEAVLLDLNMPGIGGFEACRQIRRLVPGLSIIVLSARDTQDDKVSALDAGADDYVTKPFHIAELLARLRSAVRRTRAAGGSGPDLLSIGDIDLDVQRRVVRKANRILHLTPIEFDLLHTLMANAGIPMAHRRLLRAVWGPEHGNELEYLRTFVRQIRLKIEDNPNAPTYLLTEAYVGYRFRALQDEPGSSDQSE